MSIWTHVIDIHMKRKPGNPGIKGRLLDKCIDAFILALETINRISIQYRLETSCYLICNAWELLLKAKIIHGSGKASQIYYVKKRGEQRRSLSLRDCIKTIYQNENDPVRRNIERIADLRDAATHHVISSIPIDIIGLFQACVINFNNSLGKWFGVSVSDRAPLGMMAIVYDISPQNIDLSNAKMRRELGKDTAIFLASYCSGIREEHLQFGKAREYCIGIEYRLALTKSNDKADISLAGGQGSAEILGVLEVAKDPSTTHPYRLVELIKSVNDTLVFDYQVNKYDIMCVIALYNIKQRPEFYYRGEVKGSPAQYSPQFSSWLSDKYYKNNNFFTKARELFKQIRSKAKK